MERVVAAQADRRVVAPDAPDHVVRALAAPRRRPPWGTPRCRASTSGRARSPRSPRPGRRRRGRPPRRGYRSPRARRPAGARRRRPRRRSAASPPSRARSGRSAPRSLGRAAMPSRASVRAGRARPIDGRPPSRRGRAEDSRGRWLDRAPRSRAEECRWTTSSAGDPPGPARARRVATPGPVAPAPPLPAPPRPGSSVLRSPSGPMDAARVGRFPGGDALVATADGAAARRARHAGGLARPRALPAARDLRRDAGRFVPDAGDDGAARDRRRADAAVVHGDAATLDSRLDPPLTAGLGSFPVAPASPIASRASLAAMLAHPRRLDRPPRLHGAELGYLRPEWDRARRIVTTGPPIEPQTIAVSPAALCALRLIDDPGVDITAARSVTRPLRTRVRMPAMAARNTGAGPRDRAGGSRAGAWSPARSSPPRRRSTARRGGSFPSGTAPAADRAPHRAPRHLGLRGLRGRAHPLRRDAGRRRGRDPRARDAPRAARWVRRDLSERPGRHGRDHGGGHRARRARCPEAWRRDRAARRARPHRARPHQPRARRRADAGLSDREREEVPRTAASRSHTGTIERAATPDEAGRGAVREDPLRSCARGRRAP